MTMWRSAAGSRCGFRRRLAIRGGMVVGGIVVRARGRQWSIAGRLCRGLLLRGPIGVRDARVVLAISVCMIEILRRAFDSFVRHSANFRAEVE